MSRGADDGVRPLILFSLPRSGSTLLQRVLAAHEGIVTTAEPWLLLPLAFTLTPGAGETATALTDFFASSEGGRSAFADDLHGIVLSAYARAAGPGVRYFLDKTPNYHLVASEIMSLLPEGRFIFLWRHPLSVVASNVETFGPPWFDPYSFRGDIFDGTANLVAAFERHRDRAYAVRYEDLLRGDARVWHDLMAYLEMPFDPAALQRFASVELVGQFQDPTGVHRYKELNREPLEKWKRWFAGPVRREWARRYVRWIGEARLRTMGYDLGDMLDDIDRIEGDWRAVPRDFAALARSRNRRWRRNAVVGAPDVEAWRALLR